MRFAATLALAFAIAFAFAAPSARAAAATPVPTAGPASGPDRKAILVDFVEYGRVDRSVARDLALVDVVNLSEHVLDFAIGEGSSTLKPGERVIARVKQGDPAVKVSARAPGIEPVEGSLHVEAGLHYELALGYGKVPEGVASADASAGSPAPDGSPQIAPKPPGAAGATTAAPGAPRRTKGGKVDIGRRTRR